MYDPGVIVYIKLFSFTEWDLSSETLFELFNSFEYSPSILSTTFKIPYISSTSSRLIKDSPPYISPTTKKRLAIRPRQPTTQPILDRRVKFCRLKLNIFGRTKISIPYRSTKCHKKAGHRRMSTTCHVWRDKNHRQILWPEMRIYTHR